MSGFNATPTDGSQTPIPMPTAVAPNDKQPYVVRGGPVHAADTQGNALVDVSMYIYDGNNIVEGATTDTAVTSDANGTLSGKIRGLVKMLADMWDSVNHRLHVNVDAGSITANAGTNLNTSTLALESGGNLATLAGVVSSSKAAVKAVSGDFADGASATLGAKGDAAVIDPTLSASVIALLKGMQTELIDIEAQSTTTPVVSGSVTANAGANLNTSTLALEAGGNLASLVTNTADLLADGDHLVTIDTSTANIPAKGTAVMTGSTPVTIATNDTVMSELLTDTDNLATLVTNTADLLADGDFLATLGNKTDAKSTATDATSISIMQVLKEISAMVQAPASTPVTGTFWQGTQPVSLSSIDITDRAARLIGALSGVNGTGVATATNPVPVGAGQAATSTLSNVAASAADTSLLASNTGRKGVYITNDGTAILYLEFGSGAASSTNYTVQIPAQGFYEMPTLPVYTGAIRGIWSAVNGNARITELS